MNIKTAIFVALVLSIFLVGCESKTSGYAAYNQPQGQAGQQPNVVGGGCGVAPSGDYQDTPVKMLESAGSAL